MKKGLIFATTLAMALGVGVAVGAHQQKAVKAEAAGETTLYLDTNKLTWYGDQSRAYLYGTGGNNGWPGQALTQVEGSIYKLEVANMSNYQNVIFLRSNGTDVWNRTSRDQGTAINLPADWSVSNMWKFSDSWDGNQYDDGNYTGSWTKYTPAPEPEVEYDVTCVVDGKAEDPVKVAEGSLPAAKLNKFDKTFDGWYTTDAYSVKVTEITANATVYGRYVPKATATYTIDDGYAKKFTEYHLYAWNDDGINADWPGVEVSEKSVTVPTDAQFIINNGDPAEGKEQTVNISQEGAKAYLRLLNTTDGSGHYNVEWKDAAQDVPASEGYYIKGSASGWQYVAANKMSTEDLHEGDSAQLIGFEAKANDEIRVCSYYTDRAPFEQWASLQGGKSDVGTLVGDNLKFTADGTYDVYAKYVNDEFLFDVVAHAEPEPDPVYTIVNRSNDPVTFELDEEGKPEGVLHQYSAQIQYACRGGEVKFYADGVQITEHIGVDAGDEEHINNVYGNTTDGFRIRHTSNYSGYTKVFLKTYQDGGYSVWGEGFAQDEFYVTVKTGSGSVAHTLRLDTEYEPNETYIEQYKTSAPVFMKALAGTEWETSNSVNCEGLTMSITPEEVAGNNAMQAFQGTAWKVHNDCTENIYLKVRRSDLRTFIYVGGYEEAHVLTIGGKTVNLSNNGDGQYVAHGVALAAGDEVTSYTIEGVAQTVTSKPIGNNNLTEGKKVVANVESADIYYNVEAKTLWISGLPAAGQHLLKNGNTAIEMNHTDPYEGYDQYASGMLTFAANDTIKVLDTSAASSYAVTWCPENVHTSPALEGKFVYDSENHQMKCVEACSAAVYLKIKSGVDEVYFGDVPEYVTEAVEYAEGFKTAMAGACSISGSGKQAAVEAAWALQATAYAGLSAEAKAELKNEGTIVEEIQEFKGRYIAIKQQHSSWDLDNFLEIDIPANPRFSGLETTVDVENSGLVIAIIAIAATSAAALGVLLVLKKRKHN